LPRFSLRSLRSKAFHREVRGAFAESAERDFAQLPSGGAGLEAMKTLTEYLKFHSKTHRAYIHITPQVEEIVRKSGVKEGMVLVSAMHITAGVYVNDNETGLIEDIDHWLEQLAPFGKDYKHHQTGEDNGDSHLKALLIHHQVIVPITAGKLDLGTWQRIFYAEFDGQRDKRVIVKVMGE
jgi:secondary thiamine-phosphate synthase enzyme